MPLDALGIISSDPQKSIQFYKIFGIEIKPFDGDDHFEGTTSSGIRIMIDSENLIKKLNPLWKKSEGSNVVLCFKQDFPEKVDELFSKVLASGFKGLKNPWNAFWGQRYACVQDPDGVQVDIFSELKKSI